MIRALDQKPIFGFGVTQTLLSVLSFFQNLQVLVRDGTCYHTCYHMYHDKTTPKQIQSTLPMIGIKRIKQPHKRNDQIIKKLKDKIVQQEQPPEITLECLKETLVPLRMKHSRLRPSTNR